MLNLFGIKLEKEPCTTYLSDAYTEALAWHLDQLGISYKIIDWEDPEIENYPDRPKKILNDPNDTCDDPYWTEEVCVLISRFSQNILNKKIIPNLFDKDFMKEDDRRTKESWERNFGPDIPLGQDW